MRSSGRSRGPCSRQAGSSWQARPRSAGALREIARTRPDIVLLDVQLPGPKRVRCRTRAGRARPPARRHDVEPRRGRVRENQLREKWSAGLHYAKSRLCARARRADLDGRLGRSPVDSPARPQRRPDSRAAAGRRRDSRARVVRARSRARELARRSRSRGRAGICGRRCHCALSRRPAHARSPDGGDRPDLVAELLPTLGELGAWILGWLLADLPTA